MLVARLSPHLTAVEIIAATVPVGTVCSAWIIFLVAVLTSAIGCGRGACARARRARRLLHAPPHTLTPPPFPCAPRAVTTR